MLQDDPTYTAGAVGAGFMLPSLWQEGVANKHALKYLTKQHGIPRGLVKGLPMIPAFMSYLGAAAVPAGITYLRKRYRNNEGPITKLKRTWNDFVE